MKKILSILILVASLGCTSTSRHESANVYGSDYKTVFQASLSTLKDLNFTIRTFDWNSGEIDAYRQYKEGNNLKIVLATVALEDLGGKVKVRITLKQGVDSAPVSKSEFISNESEFLSLLRRSIREEMPR